jgi:hypothetical protein
MKKDSLVRERVPVLAERIVSSLQYLYSECPDEDMRAIVKIALNLCYSIHFTDAGYRPPVSLELEMVRAEDITCSLMHLKEEAARNNLEDMEEILDGCFKLCLVTHYLHLRGIHCKAN